MADDTADPGVRDRARAAWALGVAAVTLAMVGPCMYYVPMMIALPLGLVAIIQARSALASARLDGVSQVYAQTGQINAILALAWSTLVLGIFFLVIALYVGMVFLMVGLMAIVGEG